MTARQVYENVLVELGKINAPVLKLYEFNYLFNKAINQYINTIYTKIYDQNQQAADDLRVLKSTAYLTPVKCTLPSRAAYSLALLGATYETNLPLDYLHILNCICVYKVNKTKDCWDAGSYILIPATRLTADSWALVVSDVYNRPSPMHPYFYLHNQASSAMPDILPLNPTTVNSLGNIQYGTDMSGEYKVKTNVLYIKVEGTTSTGTSITFYIMNDLFYTTTSSTFDPATAVPLSTTTTPTLALAQEVINKPETTSKVFYPNPEDTVAKADGTNIDQGSNFPRTFKLDLNNDGTPDTNISLVEKPIGLRAANPSTVRMEIRYGRDASVFELVEVQVDYVKAPQHIRLTQEQIDLTEDTSQIMEFPDYVCHEIINGLVTILMLRNNDPKIQSKYGIDQQIQQAVLLNQPAMVAQPQA